MYYTIIGKYPIIAIDILNSYKYRIFTPKKFYALHKYWIMHEAKNILNILNINNVSQISIYHIIKQIFIIIYRYDTKL